MNEKTIKSFVIFVILSVLIVVRAFFPIDSRIISGVNFVGFAVALISLLFDIRRYLKKRHYAVWIMITAIILVIFIVVAVLIFLGVICINEKADDLITLGALCGTLSAPFFIAIFNKGKIIEKE